MAEDLQQRPARPEHRNWRNWDFLSIGAFTAAAGFGLFAIANKIRESFWKNIIHGYGENETVFTDIVEKYIGTKEARHGHARSDGRVFPNQFNEHFERHKTGEWSLARVDAENATTVKAYRKEIADKLLKEYRIPTYGIAGWTEGIVKRWNKLGKSARMDTSFGAAGVTAVAIGAIAVLRHSKHTLDRIETKLDAAQEPVSRY